jgi:hypothetical protein
VRNRLQYPFDPPAVEDYLVLVLAYMLAFPKIQCSQQPVMPNLMKLAFSLALFQGRLTTAIPGGIGTFTGFNSLGSGGVHTAFIGTGSNGQAGIYLASTLSKVVAVGDLLNGKRVTALRFGRNGLDGVNLAYTAELADGSQGVFRVRVDNYAYTGFLAPINNPPVLNQVKAGQNIPVKFSLHGNQGLAIIAQGYPLSQQVVCSTSAPFDDIEEVIASASGLSYDASNDQYNLGWKTLKAWANTCREFQLRLNDGTLHKAFFKFK